MSTDQPAEPHQQSASLLDEIERTWRDATTRDEMRRAIVEMCSNPSYRWRKYLDLFWAWQKHPVSVTGHEAVQIEAIASLEEPLADAVAEGLARENGVLPAQECGPTPDS